MKIKNETELLEIFCDKDCPRIFGHTPFYNTKYNEVWSTDDCILIRINPKILVGEYPKRVLLMPKLESPCEKIITIEALNKSLEAYYKFDKKVMVGDMAECEECGGSGDLVYKYTDRNGNTHEHIHDCPFCDGAGEIECEKAKNIIIEVGPAHFFAKQLQILKQAMDFLNVTSVKVTNINCMEVGEFVVNNDIRIIIASIPSDCLKKCNAKLESHIL